MGYEDNAAVEAAHTAKIMIMNQQLGRSQAMSEIREWAHAHKDMLRTVNLYESLLNATLQ